MKKNKIIIFILIAIGITSLHLFCTVFLFGHGFALGDQLQMTSSDKVLSTIISAFLIILGFPLLDLAAIIAIVFSKISFIVPIFAILNSILWGIFIPHIYVRIKRRKDITRQSI